MKTTPDALRELARELAHNANVRTLSFTAYRDIIFAALTAAATAAREEERERAKPVVEQLLRLVAIVHGECKSILDEEDGGQIPRDEIAAALAAYRAGQDGEVGE